jgi:hypothetical protein
MRLRVDSSFGLEVIAEASEVKRAKRKITKMWLSEFIGNPLYVG